MPNYRYFTTDLLTETVLGDVTLYGVAFDRMLGRAGNFTGTFKLGRGTVFDTLNLSCTQPGRTAIYVERDGTLIWGGIIWTRTYQAQSKTIQLTAQTFESYFDHVIVRNDFIKQNMEQLQIFKDLIDALQNQIGSDIGLITDDINATPSGVKTTVLVPGYEYHYASEIIEQMTVAENAFDWTIEVTPSANIDQPAKYVRVGYPHLGNSGSDAFLTFDYPGNIATYWWPESATAGGTRFAFLGAGAGRSMLRAEQVAQDLINQGYPSWWKIETDKNLGYQELLDRRVAMTRDKYRIPVSTPTFTLKPDRIPPFEAWSALGVNFTAHIEDVRFPQGKDVVSRMIGWSLRINDAEDTEELQFVIEGDEESVAV